MPTEPRSTGGTVVTLPDNASSVVLRLGADGRRELMVAGPRTRALYQVADDPGPSCVHLRLRPGQVRDLVDGPVRELVDRLVPIAAPDTRRLSPPTPDDELVAAATGLLATSGVGATARRLGVSERRLRDLFAHTVGLAPKQFARIDRVRAVLTSPADDLAAVAVRSGYYDQSHMTTEFHRLMGVPPAAFKSGLLPAPSPCQRNDP